jgi:hypothetical protein
MNDTPTPETDAEWRKPMSEDARGKRMFHHARKLERERNQLAGYICRIKLPLPVRFVADLAKVFHGKNIRMKDVDGYLCIFSENAGGMARELAAQEPESTNQLDG